jgi:transcriptional regulator with XRE-family HTH domain
MYHLNRFCNILARLRQDRAWTQTALAEKLNVSPQAVSRWESGIGYPDVTMFPSIAEVFSIPIGVLFGEEKEIQTTEETEMGVKEFCFDEAEISKVFVTLGNLCRIEFIQTDNDECWIDAEGDPIFLAYLDAEVWDHRLTLSIKNPSGSNNHWEAYDRRGYEGENQIRIHINRDADLCIINYLDLCCRNYENERGNLEVLCTRTEDAPNIE